MSVRKPIFKSKARSQRIYEQTTDMARYSTSVEDLETLLHFQEIKLSPKNMHHPIVDRHIQTINPTGIGICFKIRELPVGKNKPRVGV